MFKKLLAMISGSFLPSTAAVVPAVSRMRHMDIISPPNGFPSRIEWNLDDAESVTTAERQISALKDTDRARDTFTEVSPGEIGKKLGAPDTKEHMISMPQVYGG